MKKVIHSIIFTFLTLTTFAQGTLERGYKVSNDEDLKFDFKYPQVIKLKTWDKQEVQINARVMINNQDRTEDFLISESRRNGKLIITSELKNLEKHSSKYVTHSDDDDDESVIVSKNGNSVTIGGNSNKIYNGTKIDIQLEVIVPASASVELIAKYGIAEIINLPRSLSVDAKYGGADIMLIESQISSLEAHTSWGQIFSNLEAEIEISGDDMMGKQMQASLKNNSGSYKIRLASEYGNVYLRKN